MTELTPLEFGPWQEQLIAVKREAAEREVSQLKARVAKAATLEEWHREQEMLNCEKELLTAELSKSQKKKLKRKQRQQQVEIPKPFAICSASTICRICLC